MENTRIKTFAALVLMAMAAMASVAAQGKRSSGWGAAISEILDLVEMDTKHYSDWATGYSGDVAIEFKGTTRSVDPKKIVGEAESNQKKSRLFPITRYCEKLSKEESFLIWKALGEYDIKDDEVYSVIVAPDDSDSILNVVVVTADNCKNFRMCGGFYF